MESWRFTADGGSYVLRRLPEGVTGGTGVSGQPLSVEAAVIRRVREHGVLAPEIMGELQPSDGLCDGYVMRAIAGETLPHKILGNPDYANTDLIGDCARELARIHAVPTDGLPLSAQTPSEMLEALRALYADAGDIPAFALALDWLETHLPEPVAPRLLHGDFRMGNLMVTPEGLSGVLDWELVHLGDPAQDIGFLCAPSWRFGHWERTVGGFGELEAFLDAYAVNSGDRISEERVRFWMIYSSLWWGLVCVQMHNQWRTGEVRMLERPVIGRRVSETEVDLLLLLDDGGAGKLTLELNDETSPVGAATTVEILTALSEWTTRVIEVSSGHSKFEARIARNALGILAREASLGPPPEGAALTEIRRSALHRLMIDQPGYAGLEIAKERWLT